jgi:hypothetical protein
MIDQHAWRGYCRLTKRSEQPEFPTYQPTALKLYDEYEKWFLKQLDIVTDRRGLDKALMAFGQFFDSQFRRVGDYYLQNHSVET